MTGTYNKKRSAAAAIKDELAANGNPAETALPEKDSGPRENSAETGGVKHFSVNDAAAGFAVKFLNEDACRDWVVERLHPKGEFCVNCGESLDDSTAIRFLSGLRCQCKAEACGHWFTARTGTFLQGAQLSYGQVFLLAALIDIMRTGITPQRIAEVLEVSADTVRIWEKRFKAFEI